MATQPTNQPVPSGSPRDLKFNAGKIDEFVTSMARQYIDRFGNAHYTIEGMRWIAQQAIAAFGYITLDSFEDGNTLTLPNQVLRLKSTGEYYRWDGVFPKVVPAGSTPESTGGIGTGAWLSVGDATLRGDLAKTTGAGLVGYKWKQSGSSVYRTLQDKLGDFVSVLDFGAKGDGVTDDSAAFSNAAATGKKVFIPDTSGNGSGCIYRVKSVYITKPLLFGEHMGVEIQPVSSGDEMFYFGDPSKGADYIIVGGRIENLTFSDPNAVSGSFPVKMRFHQQQQMEIFGCTFYGFSTDFIDYRFVTLRKVRGISSKFYGSRTSPNNVDFADSFIITDSFIAYQSQIEMRNSVGFQIRNTYCANPTNNSCILVEYDDWAKPSHGTCQFTDVTVEGVTRIKDAALFVFLTNCHMGAFQGNGIELTNCFAVNCVNSEFHYSLDWGVYLTGVNKSSFTNTRFTNNGEGGCRIGGNSRNIAFMGCLFGEGGIENDGPTQQRGINIEDTSTSIVVLSSTFSGNTVSNIGGSPGTYRAFANFGVTDTPSLLYGTTAQRPVSPIVPVEYYDTTLGLPVWWNTTTSTWKRADGTNT
ncbi:right-handed parallel beta-helix repeat-containing protein [Citrobacter portucalensis]|uniref:tail fiber/spike domain-containing protein n=1 Tax=Citrobacter portucalensis TaxID=1639133 RepID=UPI002DBA53F0|nr:right-handed parallel beta-helix repeat-containing protein [Citrobacter portucalensis]MEB6519450.1 right-handed parallel beta-helix repeat-containing protein [Citrobacter portucalensis]